MKNFRNELNFFEKYAILSDLQWKICIWDYILEFKAISHHLLNDSVTNHTIIGSAISESQYTGGDKTRCPD